MLKTIIKLGFLLILCIVPVLVCGQPWLYEYQKKFKSTEETELDFRQQQQAFKNYWKGRTDTKSKGYKPFLRWENFVNERYNPNSLPDYESIWNALSLRAIDPPFDTISWKFTGPEQTPLNFETNKLTGNGRLNSVTFHPTDANTIFVGAPTGGVWITKDGGQNWRTTTDFLDVIGVSDIVISHENPQNVYIVTGDGDGNSFQTYAIGILKSIDGGETWQPTALSLNVTQRITFRRIIMHPTNANIMLATSSKGIYRTTDGWNTYKLVQGGVFKDIEFKPGNPNYIYATSYSNLGNARIYRSIDGGLTFLEVSASLGIGQKVERIELAVTPADPNIVYAVATDVSNSGLYAIYKSTNSGSSWAIVYDGKKNKNLLGYSINGSDQGGQGWYDLALAVSPVNSSLLIIGGINIWRSTNGGTEWKIVSYTNHETSYSYVHADQHMISFGTLQNAVYAANDGGIYKSTNNGLTWTDISNNLKILQSYRLDVSDLTPGKILSGNQDNGTFYNTGSEWFEVFGADGMECIFDRDNDSIFYLSIYYGDFYRTNDGGVSFKSIKPDASLTGSWITPLEMHPRHSNILYSGYQDVYKSTDYGNSWSKISNNLCQANLISIAIAPSNDDYIYAATQDTIFKTRDGGLSWTSVNANLPFLNIASVTVSPNDPNKVWVCFSSFTAGEKIYFTTNGGSSWTNISDSLPNVPARKLVIRENSNQEMYLATDIGVYYRNASLTSWQGFNKDLPNVLIYDIKISEPFDKLYVSTYGRGIWEASLLPPIPSRADFKANITKGCINAPITLVYTSKEAFDSLKWVHSATKINYQSTSRDTIIIEFANSGRKTIELRHYLNDTLTNEVKYQYIEVLTELDINIVPTSYFMCDTSQLVIMVPEAYNYSFAPMAIVDSVSEPFIYVSPLENTNFVVTAMHGSCAVDKILPITFMPDNAKDAIFLTEGKHGPFSNSCAGREENEPTPPVGTGDGEGCISQDGWCSSEDTVRHSVWFRLVVPESGDLRVRVSGFDSKAALYKAGTYDSLFFGNYTLIAANDDRNSTVFDSEIGLLSGLIPGDTLFLQVDGSYGGVTGEFYVQITDKPSAINPVYPDYYENIDLYPNPASESIAFRMLYAGSAAVRVDILSQTGSLVYTENLYSNNGQIEKVFNTGKLSGLYFMRIRTETNTYIKKFLVH